MARVRCAGAIAAAKSGDKINFASSVHSITLTSGELDITTNLKIDGTGASKLTISGNNTSRVFAIGSGLTVTIDNVTIANGLASAGAGVDNAGNLTLASCALFANQTVGGVGGGGVFNEVGATLTLSQDAFTGNLATTSVGSDVLGGALLNLGSAAISNSTFTGNQALGGGSGTFFGGSVGGAIANSHGASLTVSNSTFTSNAAISAAGPFFVTGGAIENDAGVNNDVPSNAVISNCTFTNNVARGGDGVTGNGGGIDNQGPGSTMTVSNSTLTANQSIGGNNGNGAGAFGEGLGGGIMNALGTLTVNNCKLQGNQAIGGAGSTAGVANPPTGSGQGGAIVNLEGTLTVNNSSLTNNLAIGGNSTTGSGGIGDGGGIANWGVGLGAGLPGNAYLTNCTFTGNQAVAGSGSSGFPAAFAVGGGLDSSFSGNMYVTNCTISGNQVIGSAGVPGPMAVWARAAASRSAGPPSSHCRIAPSFRSPTARCRATTPSEVPGGQAQTAEVDRAAASRFSWGPLAVLPTARSPRTARSEAQPAPAVPLAAATGAASIAPAPSRSPMPPFVITRPSAGSAGAESSMNPAPP